jgi:hypothetical protein
MILAQLTFGLTQRILPIEVFVWFAVLGFTALRSPDPARSEGPPIAA